MNLTKLEDNLDYRLLLFPASRSLKIIEIKHISERIFEFLSTWNAHGAELESSFKIEHNQFIIICVDEDKEKASGCSIDSLTRLMKELDTEYNLGLFDRMKVCVLLEDKVETLEILDFKAKVQNNTLMAETKIFDFSVDSYYNYLRHFVKPISESWASKYL